MRKLAVEERLITAADYKPVEPNGRDRVRAQVLGLADSLNGTGVYLKVNSALRACGYGLIDEIHARGLRTFADLKVFDIKETLATDGALLREAKPSLLTVVCATGISAMKALKAELPETEVLGVTVLTNFEESDTSAVFECSTEEAVRRFAALAAVAGLDGLISSAKQAEMLRRMVGSLMSINTPAIRPAWAIVQGDDQNPENIVTPTQAIRLGADRIVVGRPITKADNPRDAVMRTLEEIASALE